MRKMSPIISLAIIMVGIFLVVPLMLSEPNEVEEIAQKPQPQPGKEISVPTYIVDIPVEVTAVADIPRAEEIVEETPKRKYYDIPLSIELQDYIYQALTEYELPETYHELILKMMYVESRYKVDAENGSCIGLLQVSTIHEEKLNDIGVTDLKDPFQNIRAGVFMLKECCNFADNLKEDYPDAPYVNLILLAYNNGNSGAKKLLKKGTYETDYTNKVVSAAIESQG